MDHRGQVAVITGASSGIGQGLARHCAQLGMTLVIADINATGLARLEHEFNASDTTCLSMATDVADPVAVERLAEASYAAYGRVDMLFNNAGVLQAGYSWECSPQDWQRLMGINAMGVFNGLRSYVPRFLSQEGGAHIINTASVGALLSTPMLGPYTASKMAVRGITETLWLELQQVKPELKVSLLCPGPIATAITTANKHVDDEEILRMMKKSLPLRDRIDLMSPAECARITFEGIARGDFWIFTHPEFKQLCLSHSFQLPD